MAPFIGFYDLIYFLEKTRIDIRKVGDMLESVDLSTPFLFVFLLLMPCPSKTESLGSSSVHDVHIDLAKWTS